VFAKTSDGGWRLERMMVPRDHGGGIL